MTEGEMAREDGEAAAPAGVATTRRSARSGFTAHRRHLTAIGAAVAVVLWGTWVSHTLFDLQHHSPHLVKVELADIVREYVQAEARSGAPADQITAQTGAFLKVLNDAVNVHAAHGEIVLLGNAVVGGDVTDITDAVRGQVYARVPRPQPGPGQGLSPPMQQFFQPNGATGFQPHGASVGNDK